MKRHFLSHIFPLYAVVLCTSVCFSDDRAIYCHGELEGCDPRLIRNPAGTLRDPRIAWREFVVPDGGSYRWYYDHSRYVDPCEQEVLQWLRSEYCQGFNDLNYPLVQLSEEDHQGGARNVQALCLAAHDDEGCLRGDRRMKLRQQFFTKLKSLQHLRHLELYHFDMDRGLFGRLAELLGDLEYLGLPHDTSDEHLELLTGLKKLKFLNASDTKISGRGLAALGKLPNLQTVDLRRNQLASGSLVGLGACDALETLLLSESNISDEDMKALSALPELKYVSLHKTAITDKAVEYLLKIEDLKYVSLYETSVTQEGHDKLRKAHPRVTIDLERPDSLREFLKGRYIVHACLGEESVQFGLAKENGQPGRDVVEALKWSLVVKARRTQKPPRPRLDKATDDYIEAGKRQLNEWQIAEAQARAGAYLYLDERSTFNIQLERREGLPLYQYKFGPVE